MIASLGDVPIVNDESCNFFYNLELLVSVTGFCNMYDTFVADAGMVK